MKGYLKVYFSYNEGKKNKDYIMDSLKNQSVYLYRKESYDAKAQMNQIIFVENFESGFRDICQLKHEGKMVVSLLLAKSLEKLKDEGFSGTVNDSMLREIDEIEIIDHGKLESIVKQRYGSLIYRNKQKEHILVCLSTSPSNSRIIKTAARMKKAFDSQFTALYVQTPSFSLMSLEDQKRLQENQKLAKDLGAHIEVVFGEDVPYQIAEFARLSSVTKIILGKSTIVNRHGFRKYTLTEELLSYAPDIDIHIIPDQNVNQNYHSKRSVMNQRDSILINTIKSISILAGATLLSIIFSRLGFTDSNIIMVYILGVLLTSVATTHQWYSLVSSITSVIIFNYLFTVPRFSLAAYGTGYPVTFVVMFMTAYITGNFAIRYKEQAKQSSIIAYRTKILFDTTQVLSKASGRDEIIDAMANQLIKLLDRNIVMYENVNGILSNHRMYPSDMEEPFNPQREYECAKWVFENNHMAGATTDMFADADFVYLALRVNDRIYGVVGIDVRNGPVEAFEHEILLSILGEAALTLENEKNAREKEEAAILAESEQLRANLLRAISHDLRTPLTTISGNASNLLKNSEKFDSQTTHQIYTDIYNDSIWLNNLVENLLYATRFEEGGMHLRLSDELLSEIVETALQHINLDMTNHCVKIDCEDDLLLVKVDGKLIVQVIINIIDNAIKYTPDYSEITISIKRVNDMAQVEIIDNGPGIPDEEKKHVFEKFYYGNNKIIDNRRSLGLGLYLCKAIVDAHGGQIEVLDHVPHGSIFRFTLPIKEINVYE